jgi:hypothetical protein
MLAIGVNLKPCYTCQENVTIFNYSLEGLLSKD